MTHRHYSLPVSIIVAAIMMSACVPSTPAPTPTATPCPPVPLVAPQVFSPNGVLVTSLQPTFQWFYPADCPGAFVIDFALDGDFNAPGVISEQTSGPQTTWTPTQALQPASMYQWRVQAFRGGTSGPHSPALWFWTGPICNANIPAIPELVSPIQGAIVNDPSPPLDWIYPAAGCLAAGFEFEVSEQPDFLQTALSGSGSSPWTGFETNVDFLQDCTDYFWRVAVVHNAQVSILSDVEEFSTDFQGNCSMATQQGPEIYAIGCIGTQSMMFTFEFPEPPQDDYEVRAEGNTYECVLNAERPMLLHCSGVRTEIVSAGLVELVETETEEVIFARQARFPNCDQPPCSGLSQDVCLARSDCKWIPGATGFSGFCTDN